MEKESSTTESLVQREPFVEEEKDSVENVCGKEDTVRWEAWAALLVFFLLGFVQCAVWATFGQVPSATKAAYDVDKVRVKLTRSRLGFLTRAF